MIDYSSLSVRRHWEIKNGKVYSGDRILREADVSTFETLNYLYARDVNKVYYSFGKIENADPATFQTLDSGASFNRPSKFLLNFQSYACDKNNVYHYAYTVGKPSIVRSANPSAFHSINGNFGFDDKAVFCGHNLIKYAQVKSWTPLQGYYSCDDDFCFYGNKRIAGANRNTFICLWSSFGTWAKDHYRYYHCGNESTQEKYLTEFEEMVMNFGKIKDALINGSP